MYYGLFLYHHIDIIILLYTFLLFFLYISKWRYLFPLFFRFHISYPFQHHLFISLYWYCTAFFLFKFLYLLSDIISHFFHFFIFLYLHVDIAYFFEWGGMYIKKTPRFPTQSKFIVKVNKYFLSYTFLLYLDTDIFSSIFSFLLHLPNITFLYSFFFFFYIFILIWFISFSCLLLSPTIPI